MEACALSFFSYVVREEGCGFKLCSVESEISSILENVTINFSYT